MKIMVAYEKTNGSELILDVAIQQAKALDAEIHLVTSLIVSTLDEEKLAETAKSVLDRVKTTIESNGIACQTFVLIRGQSEADDLLKHADKHQIDEIVIGVKNRSKVGKMFLGSATQDVLIGAQCPVLVVKAS